MFVLALILGAIGIGLGLFQVTVWIEPQSPDISSVPAIEPPEAPAVKTVKKVEELAPVLPTGASALPSPTTSPLKSPEPAEVAARQGALRVSNQTDHPIRLALLAQRLPQKAYKEPAHWDFAPMEGGNKGLILSLPQSNLKLSKGDILVAFAQDGSRLYWGPYVVGETPLPVWNQQKAEWELAIQP